MHLQSIVIRKSAPERLSFLYRNTNNLTQACVEEKQIIVYLRILKAFATGHWPLDVFYKKCNKEEEETASNRITINNVEFIDFAKTNQISLVFVTI